jgi:hypothetical protein
MRVFYMGGGEVPCNRERGKGTQGERGSENRWAARGYDYKKRKIARCEDTKRS